MKKKNGQIVLDWVDIHQACATLSGKVKASGARISAVVAIPRGGLIPAAIMAYYLGVPVREHVLLPTDLIIDEIVDSGRVHNGIRALYPKNLFVCLVLNTKNYPATQSEPPHVIDVQRYVVFPWEKTNNCKEC